MVNDFGKTRIPLTNSTYFPTSYLYRNGRAVYLKCAGYTLKEIPAELELTVATESNVPEEYRPDGDIVVYTPLAFDGTMIRVAFYETGKVTFTAPQKLSLGAGINVHLSFMNNNIMS